MYLEVQEFITVGREGLYRGAGIPAGAGSSELSASNASNRESTVEMV